MSFKLEVKAVAIRQAAQAYKYYEQKSPGLGKRYLAALEEAYATLREEPFFQVRKAPYRHLKLRRFPYRLVYEVLNESVVIYQVRHTNRKPHRKYGP